MYTVDGIAKHRKKGEAYSTSKNLATKGNSNQKVTPGSDGEEDLCEVRKRDTSM